MANDNSNYFNKDRVKKIATYTLAGTAIGALVGNRAGTGAGIGAVLGALTGGVKEISPDQINLDKPSVILFYMPTCPACIRFKPVYEELEKILKSENIKIQLYSINTSKYDISGINLPEPIRVVPTLVIVPGKNKMPIMYKQNMSAMNIANQVSNVIEGGARHRRKMMWGGDAPEAGARNWRWMMYGGETAPVEGGEVPVEGGKRHRRRMYGGETAPVEGGESAPVEGGEVPVEGGEKVSGGYRSWQIRGSPAAKRHMARLRAMKMSGGEVTAVEGGEMEGGKKKRSFIVTKLLPTVAAIATTEKSVNKTRRSPTRKNVVELEKKAEKLEIQVAKAAPSPKKKRAQSVVKTAEKVIAEEGSPKTRKLSASSRRKNAHRRRATEDVKECVAAKVAAVRIRNKESIEAEKLRELKMKRAEVSKAETEACRRSNRRGHGERVLSITRKRIGEELYNKHF